MNTAVSVTGRKNCTSGTATRARPNPVNPLTTLAKKMIPDMASICRDSYHFTPYK